MLKNFSCFQLTFCCSNMGGFWKHDAWHKTLFLLVITNSFVVPCTVCEILLVPALEIKGTGSAWPPIFGSKKDLFWRIWNSCWDLFLFHLEGCSFTSCLFRTRDVKAIENKTCLENVKSEWEIFSKMDFFGRNKFTFSCFKSRGKGVDVFWRAPISFFLLIRKSFLYSSTRTKETEGKEKNEFLGSSKTL